MTGAATVEAFDKAIALMEKALIEESLGKSYRRRNLIRKAIAGLEADRELI